MKCIYQWILHFMTNYHLLTFSGTMWQKGCGMGSLERSSTLQGPLFLGSALTPCVSLRCKSTSSSCLSTEISAWVHRSVPVVKGHIQPGLRSQEHLSHLNVLFTVFRLNIMETFLFWLKIFLYMYFIDCKQSVICWHVMK